jgi:hypothetical protein
VRYKKEGKVDNENPITRQKTLLVELGNRLGAEVKFWQQGIKASKAPTSVIEWMQSLVSSFNYGAFLIKSALSILDDHQHIPQEQLAYYVGKIAIQPFLEVVNAFEQLANRLLDQSPKFRLVLDERAATKIALVENNWTTGATGESKKLKKQLIRHLKHKPHEMAFIRDTMKKEGVIDETDHAILSFAWDIRNSMHLNYTAIRDIDFEYPDIKTGKRYCFRFKKGQELYHPDDLVSFQVITEQIIFIFLKILHLYSENDSTQQGVPADA